MRTPGSNGSDPPGYFVFGLIIDVLNLSREFVVLYYNIQGHKCYPDSKSALMLRNNLARSNTICSAVTLNTPLHMRPQMDLVRYQGKRRDGSQSFVFESGIYDPPPIK